jgi:hypothetical protein
MNSSDIRARHCRIHLANEFLPVDNRLVFRSRYICNGSCQMVFRDVIKTARSYNDKLKQVARGIQRSLAMSKQKPFDRASRNNNKRTKSDYFDGNQDGENDDEESEEDDDRPLWSHQEEGDSEEGEGEAEGEGDNPKGQGETYDEDGSKSSDTLSDRSRTKVETRSSKRCTQSAQCIVSRPYPLPTDCPILTFSQVEITSDQLSTGMCTIFTLRHDTHRVPKDLRVLKASRHVLGAIFEKSLVFGQTQRRLEIWFTQRYSTTDPYCRHLFENDLGHRLPKSKDYHSLIATFKRRSRLDVHCLAAIEILVKRNPQAFIHHNVPTLIGRAQDDFDPSTRFECVIAPPNGLDVAILWGFPVGIAMDSSWRNKNNQRCPLTLIVTIDQFHHMRPIAAMVSLYADTEAYATMLRSLRDAVEARARSIVAGEVELTFPTEYHDQIHQNALAITEDGFWPQFVMIDGADPERLAIQQVYPGLAIRLCQFHFMQSVSAHLRGIFGISSPESKLKVNQCLNPIREAQRCASEEEWESTRDTLRSAIQEVAGEDERGLEQADEIMEYLESQWFGDLWREYCVDYGLPPWLTNDGFAGTNNWVEAAFRVIDRIFLNCRANNRSGAFSASARYYTDSCLDSTGLSSFYCSHTSHISPIESQERLDQTLRWLKS